MTKKALFLATENAEILYISLATDYTDYTDFLGINLPQRAQGTQRFFVQLSVLEKQVS